MAEAGLHSPPSKKQAQRAAADTQPQGTPEKTVPPHHQRDRYKPSQLHVDSFERKKDGKVVVLEHRDELMLKRDETLQRLKHEAEKRDWEEKAQLSYTAYVVANNALAQVELRNIQNVSFCKLEHLTETNYISGTDHPEIARDNVPAGTELEYWDETFPLREFIDIIRGAREVDGGGEHHRGRPTLSSSPHEVERFIFSLIELIFLPVAPHGFRTHYFEPTGEQSGHHLARCSYYCYKVMKQLTKKVVIRKIEKLLTEHFCKLEIPFQGKNATDEGEFGFHPSTTGKFKWFYENNEKIPVFFLHAKPLKWALKYISSGCVLFRSNLPFLRYLKLDWRRSDPTPLFCGKLPDNILFTICRSNDV